MNQIILRKDTATNWATYDPILALGEIGFDTTNNLLKIGDGITSWSGLNILAGKKLEERTVSASNAGSVMKPGQGYYGLSKITITNINSEDIVSGKTIMGVTGTALQSTGSTVFETEENDYGTTVKFANYETNDYGITFKTTQEVNNGI